RLQAPSADTQCSKADLTEATLLPVGTDAVAEGSGVHLGRRLSGMHGRVSSWLAPTVGAHAGRFGGNLPLRGGCLLPGKAAVPSAWCVALPCAGPAIRYVSGTYGHRAASFEVVHRSAAALGRVG